MPLSAQGQLAGQAILEWFLLTELGITASTVVVADHFTKAQAAKLLEFLDITTADAREELRNRWPQVGTAITSRLGFLQAPLGQALFLVLVGEPDVILTDDQLEALAVWRHGTLEGLNKDVFLEELQDNWDAARAVIENDPNGKAIVQALDRCCAVPSEAPRLPPGPLRREQQYAAEEHPEWRAALSRVFDELLSLRQCALTQLLEPDSIRMLGTAEKASASDSIIVFGKLALPSLQGRTAFEEYWKSYHSFAQFWQRVKRDVAIKLTFPQLSAAEPTGLAEEAKVYAAVNQLLFDYFTPHIVLYLATGVCEVAQLFAGRPLEPQFITAVHEIYARHGVSSVPATAPVQLLITEKGQGPSMSDWLATRPQEVDILVVLFQVVYTLAVFADFGIRHGDLHTGNVLIDQLDRPTSVAYVPRAGEVYVLPTRFLSKIFDWDFGGIYEPSGGLPEIRNPKAQQMCSTQSSCDRNTKADLFTFLSITYDTLRDLQLAPAAQQLIERLVDPVLLKFAPDFGSVGGFQYRLCRGPLPDACPTAQTVPTSDTCTGPWEPDDCWIKSPLEALAEFPFRIEWDGRPLSTPFVFGLWDRAPRSQYTTETRPLWAEAVNLTFGERIEEVLRRQRSRRETRGRPSPQLRPGATMAEMTARLEERQRARQARAVRRL